MGIRSWLRTWNARQTRAGVPPARRRRRPAVEQLENRITPFGTLVNSALDVTALDGVVTLREAIEAVNNNTATELGHTDNLLVFDEALRGETITLTQGQLTITADMSINILGFEGDALTIDAGGQSRVFQVGIESRVQVAAPTVTLAYLTITGGETTGSGGGILNRGTLTVLRSKIEDNHADLAGGGIANSGSLTIDGSRVRNNGAEKVGGGVFNLGTLTVMASTINGNTAADHGGGVGNDSGGTATVVNSTLFANAANEDGGGIYNAHDATLAVTNSTIARNIADRNRFEGGDGGGIFNASEVFPFPRSGDVTLNNTIVAGNFVRRGAVGFVGPLSDLSAGVFGRFRGAHNLVGDPATAGGLSHGVAGNIVGLPNGLNPRLPLDERSILKIDLRQSGGPTPTIPLSEFGKFGRQAQDAGDNVLAVDQNGNPLLYDQRGEGFPRIGGRAVDIGAYEPSMGRFHFNIAYAGGSVLDGSLLPAFTALPEIVSADFVLDDPIQANGIIQLHSVVAARLTFGDATWTENELEEFSATVDPTTGAVSALTYRFGAIDTTTLLSGTLSNFPLTISGTDRATGEAFTYQYAESTPTLTVLDGPAGAPVIVTGATPQPQPVATGEGLAPFADVLIADADSLVLTVTVALGDPAGGTLTNLGGFTDEGNGVYRFTGDPTDATTALRGLTFVPAANQVAPGSTVLTTFTITADDGTNPPVTNDAVSVLATETNDPPQDVGLSGGTVAENSPAGTVVGTLSTLDPDAGDSHTYTLADDAGGRFVVAGDEVRVAAGAVLDFEADPSHTVRVRATDEAGESFEKDLVIALTNVSELTGFDVQHGQTQRSFVRHVDLTFAGAADVVAADRVRLIYRGLDGSGGEEIGLAGVVTAAGDQLRFDFGPQGIGGNRNGPSGDGFYEVGLDLDGDGTFETTRTFYRLFGDVTGDRSVDLRDLFAVVGGLGDTDPERDVNGSGRVDVLDVLFVLFAQRRSLDDGVAVDD